MKRSLKLLKQHAQRAQKASTQGWGKRIRTNSWKRKDHGTQARSAPSGVPSSLHSAGTSSTAETAERRSNRPVSLVHAPRPAARKNVNLLDADKAWRQPSSPAGASALNASDEPRREAKKGDGVPKRCDSRGKSRYILFAGDLPFDTTSQQLKAFFKKKLEPHIMEVRLLTQRGTNKPKGCAFVEFDCREALQTCEKVMLHVCCYDCVIRGGNSQSRLQRIRQKNKRLKLTRVPCPKTRLEKRILLVGGVLNILVPCGAGSILAGCWLRDNQLISTGVLQLILTLLIVGIIWSIVYGGLMLLSAFTVPISSPPHQPPLCTVLTPSGQIPSSSLQYQYHEPQKSSYRSHAYTSLPRATVAEENLVLAVQESKPFSPTTRPPTPQHKGLSAADIYAKEEELSAQATLVTHPQIGSVFYHKASCG